MQEEYKGDEVLSRNLKKLATSSSKSLAEKLHDIETNQAYRRRIQLFFNKVHMSAAAT
jgi:hypothetical protein